MRWFLPIFLVSSVMSPVPSPAQISGRVHNEILETPTVRLELIGLKRWTLAMIQDSLGRYAPDDSLTTHACAAILRMKLGFPEAAVQYYPPEGSTKGYLAVPLVEPQDSARVRYRPRATESVPDRASWAAPLTVFREHNQVFQSAIQRPSFLLGRLSPDSLEPSLLSARPLLDFLRQHRTEADRRTAFWTLAHDSNEAHRALAAVIVAGFAESASAWWAVADALRDENGMVSATADQVLSTLSRSVPRPVNWSPVVDGLRALLDGTSLFTHNTVLQTLAATRVSPTLAPPLLRRGGELVVAKLGSRDPNGSRVARQFLVQISGRDFGQNADAWESWLRSL